MKKSKEQKRKNKKARKGKPRAIFSFDLFHVFGGQSGFDPNDTTLGDLQNLNDRFPTYPT